MAADRDWPHQRPEIFFRVLSNDDDADVRNLPERLESSCVIEVDAVWHAVDRLPPRQRAVLYLRYRADCRMSGSGWLLESRPTLHEVTRPRTRTLRRRLHAEDER